MIKDSISFLESYLIKEGYKGYDPYDTLNSWFPFKSFGLWFAVLATQIQKRNPINIRALLGIKKKINPKSYGLFLKSYSLLYRNTSDKIYLEKAEYFYNYLKSKFTENYSGYCWGYNFPWASPGKMVERFIPNVVSTSFIIQGMYEYYCVTELPEIKEVIKSASRFVTKDLAISEDGNGICFSYTPLWRDMCFNASLLAAEILAINYNLNGDPDSKRKSLAALEWVISHQKEDGRWNYSIDPDSGIERKQIDFHQGYNLISINSIIRYLELDRSKYNPVLNKGLKYYFENQFFPNGVSKWRIPKIWPIEIHNQSQGIITFSLLNGYDPQYLEFARRIADWTIKHMQDPGNGFFYYKKGRFIMNKIPFMRWSQAWMFLALITLYYSNNDE